MLFNYSILIARVTPVTASRPTTPVRCGNQHMYTLTVPWRVVACVSDVPRAIAWTRG